MLNEKRILLVISGGIAAYKALELIRLLRKSGARVRCILTKGGAQFITPLSVSALSEEETYTDLWSLKDETEMGHIRLAREADLIVVAPASANLISRIAQGAADDLASTTLLAATVPIVVCPAMNPAMWENPATRANIKTLQKRGIRFIGPDGGDMACGEVGVGRLSEPDTILRQITALLTADKPLAGLRALVTAGPTYEPIDPVRFIGNRSSGKQGFAIACALAERGAAVTLISGPTHLPDPKGVKTIRIETAKQMLESALATLPCDIAVCTAAVADWGPETYSEQKLKKGQGSPPSTLTLRQNEDILAKLSEPGTRRPALVVGFAAETDRLLESATAKRVKKACDWIVANQISAENPAFGMDDNKVTVVTATGAEDWPSRDKTAIARKLVENIETFFHERGRATLKAAE